MIFQNTIGKRAHVLLGEATQKDGKGSLEENSISICSHYTEMSFQNGTWKIESFMLKMQAKMRLIQ